jgi:competence protein ComEA
LRAVAVFIALLGLAGIGRVASQTPVLPAPAHALAQAGLDLGAGHGLGALASGAPPHTADPGPPPAAPAPPAPAASAVPCPTQTSSPPDAAAPPPAQPSAGVTADGRVILNRATALDLQRLPAVGAKRAAAILELRQRLGHFRTPGDLLRIKGIGRRTLERMLPQLVVDAPEEASGKGGAGKEP